MNRSEYLEFVQEGLAFGGHPDDAQLQDPALTLRDSEAICQRLSQLHMEYSAQVEETLFPERFYMGPRIMLIKFLVRLRWKWWDLTHSYRVWQ